jgi:hypothetical protein
MLIIIYYFILFHTLYIIIKLIIWIKGNLYFLLVSYPNQFSQIEDQLVLKGGYHKLVIKSSIISNKMIFSSHDFICPTFLSNFYIHNS